MFAKIVTGIVLIAAVCAMLWFGVPRVIVPMWTHVMDGEAALRAQPGLLATIAQDRVDASKASATCRAQVQNAYKSGAIVAKLSEPRPRVNGAQPSLDAAAIRSDIQ